MLCDSLTYLTRTSATCVSKADTDIDAAKLVIGSKNADCDGCAFTGTDALTPSATSLTDAGYSGTVQSITVTGTGFPTGTTATAKIGDLSATTVVVSSATSLTLTFNNGIGFGTDIPLSEVIFSDGKRTKIDAGAKLTIALGTPTVASNVECSYAGGCLWSVGATNINLLSASLSATICDTPCVHDSAASTNDLYKCRAPAVATKKAVETYPMLHPEQDWRLSNGKNGVTVSLYSHDTANFGSQAFDGD